uniref:Uncharacterized protein n=1 Tax=Marseillevirus sp. TaxID=2809551 RepID=A0AA96EPI4_9VIRU|nr:hypothetical protein MarFTMF_400 [Marseillevirus sp.]
MDELLEICSLQKKGKVLLSAKYKEEFTVDFSRTHNVEMQRVEKVVVYFDCKQFRHLAEVEMPFRKYYVPFVMEFILARPDLTKISLKKNKACVYLISKKLTDWQRYDCSCRCACKKIVRSQGIKEIGNSWEDTETYFKYTFPEQEEKVLVKFVER